MSCGEGGKYFLTVETTKVVYLCSKNKDREKIKLPLYDGDSFCDHSKASCHKYEGGKWLPAKK